MEPVMVLKRQHQLGTWIFPKKPTI